MPSGVLFTFGRDVQGKASGDTENSLQPIRLEGNWSSSGAGIHTGPQATSTFILLTDVKLIKLILYITKLS